MKQYVNRIFQIEGKKFSTTVPLRSKFNLLQISQLLEPSEDPPSNDPDMKSFSPRQRPGDDVVLVQRKLHFHDGSGRTRWTRWGGFSPQFEATSCAADSSAPPSRWQQVVTVRPAWTAACEWNYQTFRVCTDRIEWLVLTHSNSVLFPLNVRKWNLSHYLKFRRFVRNAERIELLNPYL